MGKLTGKVAIITGATKGIGLGITKAFLDEGAMVLGTYSKDEKSKIRAEQELENFKGNVRFFKADISDFSLSSEICNKAKEYFGKIDILVNNAGISKIGLFMDFTKEDIENLFNINLLGPIYLTKEVVNNMISTGGSILNISSIWGDCGASCETLYSASKGGINLFTKALGKELAMANIRVNAIAPGVINTDMNSFLNEEEKEELNEEIPMGRFGETSEIGKLAVFLCSDDSSYITGQIIKADGGMI